MGSAINAVERGNAWGALYFTENFTDALVARIALGKITNNNDVYKAFKALFLFYILKTGRDADDETLEQSEIRVWLDMSNQQIGIMLNRDMQYAYRSFAQGLLTDCGNNPKLGDVPIQFKDPIYGTNDPSFTDFVAPGVILT